MFKQSRRKIVAAIMAVLVLLWVSTLCVIYGSSYYTVSSRNREMLERHAELYVLGQQPILAIPPNDMEQSNILPDNMEQRSASSDDTAANSRPGLRTGAPHFENTPAFHLSTFYSVAIADTGELLEIRNTQTAVYTNEELEAAAREIISEEKTTGATHRLLYRVKDKGSYTLVAFMDNTILQGSMSTLFRYTLIFGGLAILALFFLAIWLAKKIVQPLEESYQKQKQFISDAGHELKTPVSVVNANAELLSRELGENQWLSNIQYENERMGTLVSQLLELARTESVVPQMDNVNLSHLVDGEALPFESVIFEKGLTFCSTITNNLSVNGSAPQLKQLTSILLDNAVWYCRPEGKITLTLKAERGFACLSVVNDGEEIPPSQRKQIFERFYRADAARSSEEKRYGLGLAIAKNIVETHNGKIAVQCYDGKVDFTVRIPLCL